MSRYIEGEGFFGSYTRRDWDLHRKASSDEARHGQKVREAIKDNLADIIAEEPIITSDGQKIVKVPVRSLQHPHFRFDPDKQNRTGAGDGDSQVGDIVASDPSKNPGSGKRAGNEPGIDYYEVDMTIDQLAEMVFEGLELPNLQDRKAIQIITDTYEFRDVRKKGPMSNLDKKRTLLENLRRNALSGDPRIGGLTDEDLRFRAIREMHKPVTRAVVMAMRDASGSMGEFEKDVTRGVYFWMVRWLRLHYQDVQIHFILHDAQAQEVDEQAFFTRGESGGTKVSTAYDLSLKILKERYPVELWNSYAFHFSDGDNWGDTDNQRCVDLVRQHLEIVNLFGYGEIAEGGRSWSSSLSSVLEQIKSPTLVPVQITQRADVLKALKEFFGKDRATAHSLKNI